MTPPPKPIGVPETYQNLPYTEIKISNYPQSASGVTPIQILTLYRPGRHNAFTLTMMEELEQAFQLFDIDDRVKCIIVTGHGRIFCAGADLNTGFRQTGEKVNDHRDGGGRVSLAIHTCRKPTIAAINGSAVGVGITMTLPMTIRLAPMDAKIGFVFGRRGLVMEAASSYFLPRLIGFARAMHLVSTGATYPANHKLFDGLFSEVLERGEDVLPRALDIAVEITENCSGVSWALMRDMMWRNPGTAEDTHILDSKIIYSMFSSKDNKEGVKAFLEKRPVKFTGTIEEDAPSVYPWWTPIDVLERVKAKNQKGSKL